MASIFSFFTGSGFLDLGFETSGFKTMMVNEFHGPFLEAYKHSRKKLGIDEPEFGYHLDSIESLVGNTCEAKELSHRVKETRLNDLVGFIGGPPCPDFSVGGKNKGQEGENGRLSRTYIDAIIQHKPDFFLFENVKGLWRTKRHREFYEELKKDLQKNGYVLTENLVNCIQYGTPQDRDRILLFGVRKSLVKHLLSAEDVKRMSLPTDLFDWESEKLFSREEALKEPIWPETELFGEDSVKPCPTSVIKELTVEYWFRKNKVDSHPNSNAYFIPRAGLPKFQSIDEGDAGKKSYKRLHRWRYSPTAAYGNNEVHLHPYKARRISAAEALALQSLPAEFELPSNMTLSNMFKTIGNGVPFLAAKGISRTIQSFLNKI
ncbi:DNA cytosine methyltransferase [Vibrio coralliilyticus]|uniref:DNA cytosine methyltransferase n=1 Tax=Vibrio coralliilyticus TaxID=190893 RepID=UPI00148BAC2A|nr:DNA cytosine methyltransferase [Vibrio coralliilyticus]NOH56169.1 DNA cytosine methyltransferase [Vibrio coralliilyticus]